MTRSTGQLAGQDEAQAPNAEASPHLSVSTPQQSSEKKQVAGRDDPETPDQGIVPQSPAYQSPAHDLTTPCPDVTQQHRPLRSRFFDEVDKRGETPATDHHLPSMEGNQQQGVSGEAVSPALSSTESDQQSERPDWGSAPGLSESDKTFRYWQDLECESGKNLDQRPWRKIDKDLQQEIASSTVKGASLAMDFLTPDTFPTLLTDADMERTARIAVAVGASPEYGQDEGLKNTLLDLFDEMDEDFQSNSESGRKNADIEVQLGPPHSRRREGPEGLKETPETPK